MKGTVTTLSLALEQRGVDLSKITEGRDLLGSLVDDTGERIHTGAIPRFFPESAITFCRACRLSSGKGFYRNRAALALSADRTRIMLLF